MIRGDMNVENNYFGVNLTNFEVLIGIGVLKMLGFYNKLFYIKCVLETSHWATITIILSKEMIQSLLLILK